MNKKLMAVLLVVTVLAGAAFWAYRSLRINGPGTIATSTAVQGQVVNSKLCDCLTGINTDFKQCDAVMSQGKYPGEGDAETNKMEMAIDGLKCSIKNGSEGYSVSFSKDETLKMADQQGTVLLDNVPVNIRASWFITHGLPVLNFKDDVNFDGYKDLAILKAIGYAGVNEVYAYYVFNPESRRFTKVQDLADVCNPAVDRDQKAIISSCKSGPSYSVTALRYQGNNHWVGEDKIDWKVYRNAEYGIVFKYPPDWTFKENKLGGLEVQIGPQWTNFYTEVGDPMLAVTIDFVKGKTAQERVNGYYLQAGEEIKKITTPNGLTFLHLISPTQPGQQFTAEVPKLDNYYLDLSKPGQPAHLVFSHVAETEAFDDSIISEILDTFTKI